MSPVTDEWPPDQSFGALAGRMIDRGLIERVPGPGRAVRHQLTAKGDELRQAGDVILQQVVNDSFSPLSEAELINLDGYLNRLVDPVT